MWEPTQTRAAGGGATEQGAISKGLGIENENSVPKHALDRPPVGHYADVTDRFTLLVFPLRHRKNKRKINGRHKGRKPLRGKGGDKKTGPQQKSHPVKKKEDKRQLRVGGNSENCKRGGTGTYKS